MLSSLFNINLNHICSRLQNDSNDIIERSTYNDTINDNNDNNDNVNYLVDLEIEELKTYFEDLQIFEVKYCLNILKLFIINY
jgi:hypothetical protein